MHESTIAGRRSRSGAAARTFQLLYDVAVAASGVLEPERLATLAAERAEQVTGADCCSLHWRVAERGLLVPLALRPVDAHPGWRLIARGEDAPGLAYDTGKPQIVQDYPGWPRAAPEVVAAGVRSVLAVPLLVGPAVEGALCVGSFRRVRWRSRQLEALSLLATLVAPALAAARRHADLAASEEGFRAVFADAQDQLLALVRELSIRRTDPTPAGEPISTSEAQALLELRTGEELSQVALAVRLRLDKSTVSRLAAQMEGRGWLERTRDAADARLVRLRLTPRGGALARDLAAMHTSRLQGILASIPDDDRDSVLQALKVVVNALRRDPVRRSASDQAC